MRDLIERLEKAAGPDRELEIAIACAVLGAVPMSNAYGGMVRIEIAGGSFKRRKCPSYTRSIDDALTLVPENWYADISARADGPTCVLQEFPKPCRRVPEMSYVIRTGITPNSQKDVIAASAIAICICALKSRALGS